MSDQVLHWKRRIHPKRNLIRERRIPSQRKFRVPDKGRRVNQELVDLDLRSTFKVVTSK